MSSIWMGIVAEPRQARVIALAGPGETILKAKLSKPAHPRAVPTLLEAIALWEGRKLRAALCVDESFGSSVTSLYPDFLCDVTDTPLYEIEWVPVARRRRRRHRDDLTGMADFADLRRIVLREVPR